MIALNKDLVPDDKVKSQIRKIGTIITLFMTDHELNGQFFTKKCLVYIQDSLTKFYYESQE